MSLFFYRKGSLFFFHLFEKVENGFMNGEFQYQILQFIIGKFRIAMLYARFLFEHFCQHQLEHQI